MPRYTVPVTILASFDIEAKDIPAAIEEARALVEALEPSQPFIEGRNEVTSAHPIFPTRILDVSGFDCERVEEGEVEEVRDDCETCAASIETRPFPCDECGHNDQDDSEDEPEDGTCHNCGEELPLSPEDNILCVCGAWNGKAGS